MGPADPEGRNKRGIQTWQNLSGLVWPMKNQSN
jgi:hypothetical protein